LKAHGHDGHLAAGTLRRLVASLEAQGVDRPDSVARAQAAWLEGAALRRAARDYPEA
jgi:hypothetical protein